MQYLEIVKDIFKNNKTVPNITLSLKELFESDLKNIKITELKKIVKYILTKRPTVISKPFCSIDGKLTNDNLLSLIIKYKPSFLFSIRTNEFNINNNIFNNSQLLIKYNIIDDEKFKNNYIYIFEKLIKNNNFDSLIVYNFKPFFDLYNNDNKNIDKEFFNKLIDILKENGVLIDFISNLPKRELVKYIIDQQYRYIIDNIDKKLSIITESLYYALKNNDIDYFQKKINNFHLRAYDLYNIFYSIIDNNLDLNFDTYEFIINNYFVHLDNMFFKYVFKKNIIELNILTVEKLIIKNKLSKYITPSYINSLYNNNLNVFYILLLSGVRLPTNYDIKSSYQQYKHSLKFLQEYQNSDSNEIYKYKLLKIIKNSEFKNNYNFIKNQYMKNIDKVINSIKNDIDLLPQDKLDELKHYINKKDNNDIILKDF